MSTNIEMNIMQSNGQYETVYPQTTTENVIGLDIELGNLENQFTQSLSNYFTKIQTLQSSTASTFGVSANAIPDDVFAYLGKYAQYWWKRTPLTASEKRTDITSMKQIVTGSSAQITYAKTISLDINGGIELQNPSTISISNDTSGAATLANRAPFYTFIGDYCYYFPEGTTGGSNSSYTLYYSTSGVFAIYLSFSSAVKAQTVSVVVNQGTPEYVQSSNRSAYPDSGTQDGYEYQYLGIPFDNAVGTPKIETGSYVGTGTYGEDNPNSLTFGFVPKLVLIETANDLTHIMVALSPMELATTINDNSNYSAVTLMWSNNVLSWYTSSAAPGTQLNTSGYIYTYIAIG